MIKRSSKQSLFGSMKKWHGIFLFFIFSLNLLSGQSQVDALLKQLDQDHSKDLDLDASIQKFLLLDSLSIIENHVEGRLHAALSLMNFYNLKGEFEKSKAYFNKTLPFISRPRDSVRLFHVYSSSIATLNSAQSQKYLESAIEISERNGIMEHGLSAMYANLGILKSKQGLLVAALEDLESAIDYAPSAYHRFQIYYSISDLLWKAENYSAAEDYILKAIKLSEDEGYKSRHGHVGLYYTRLLLHKNNYDQALVEGNKCLDYFQSLSMWDDYGIALATIVQIYIKQGDFKMVENLFDQNRSRVKTMAKKRQVEFTLLSHQLSQRKGDYQKMIDQGKLIEPFFKDWSNTKLQKSHFDWMQKAYAHTGDFKEAHRYLLLKENLSDSLYRSGQAQLVNELEAKYNREATNRELVGLAETNELQSKTLWIAGVALLLFSIFSFLLYHLWKQVSLQKKQLAKTVGQKDILLKEIHHRVKNNLQLVSSLLSSQSKRTTDKHALEAINAGKARVQSMALIHQDLYNKENLEKVNAKNYVEKLTAELYNSFSIDPLRIVLEKDLQDIELDIDTLIPLGLIMNELITNSLKYAFPNEGKGILKLVLTKVNQKIVFEAIDDGVGFDPNDSRKESFGMTLVHALVEQLEASIIQLSENGTATKIEIPYP